MDHPLYQIEKVLQKGQDNVDDMDNLEAYLEVRAFVCVCTCGDCPPPPPYPCATFFFSGTYNYARHSSFFEGEDIFATFALFCSLFCLTNTQACENYSSAISESNAMAYTSSFGE